MMALGGGRAEEPADFEIWHDNVDALTVFLNCAHKWEWLQAGERVVRTGIDWTAIRLAVWSLKIQDARQVFNDVVVMERTALEVFSEKHGK